MYIKNYSAFIFIKLITPEMPKMSMKENEKSNYSNIITSKTKIKYIFFSAMYTIDNNYALCTLIFLSTPDKYNHCTVQHLQNLLSRHQPSQCNLYKLSLYILEKKINNLVICIKTIY